jgi:hypothetical protein
MIKTKEDELGGACCMHGDVSNEKPTVLIWL